MPIAVLGLFQTASMTRYVRASVLDVIRLDYITTARAKGLGERVVITKQVVRNATAGDAQRRVAEPDPAPERMPLSHTLPDPGAAAL
jgi:Binding-protein-dependent transport system inner membrane component